MLKLASHHWVFYLFAMLLSASPCIAGEPPAMPQSIVMTSNNAAKSGTRFCFADAYGTTGQNRGIEQLLAPGGAYYRRDNTSRVTTGRILTLAGGIMTIVGTLLIVGDNDDAAARQKTIIGWSALGAGTVLFGIGLGMSGDKFIFTDRNRFGNRFGSRF